jgi:hypothetical protein
MALRLETAGAASTLVPALENLPTVEPSPQVRRPEAPRFRLGLMLGIFLDYAIILACIRAAVP